MEYIILFLIWLPIFLVLFVISYYLDKKLKVYEEDRTHAMVKEIRERVRKRIK